MSARHGEPTGKRALFEPLSGAPTEKLIRPTDPTGRSGRRSLFTVGDRRPGTVVVRCERCGSSSRLSLLEFALRHLPFWAWFPLRSHSRLLRCPACERHAWHAVRYFS